MLRCADGSIYTGIARDVAARIQAHESGRGARYTAGRGPFELCAKRRCKTHGDALRLEYAIKQLSRHDKLALTTGTRLARFARTQG
jgi:predicted GIY-YIG superfamily endonuclease